MKQNIQELIFNEHYYNAVPRPTGDEWHALDQSIAIHGCLEPITINEKGVILDGYTRYEICQNRNVQFRTTTKSFDSSEDEMRYVLEVNATRRQLNAFQRVELFYNIFKIYREQGKQNNNWRLPTKHPLGGALVRFASLVGVGQKRVHAAIKIIESDNDDLKQQCRDGTLTVNAAFRSLRDCYVIDQEEDVKRHVYPSMSKMLRHFADSPIKDQLESILQIYREANS